MSEEFQGFVPPVDDYFRMPNEWINICATIDNLAELKIVQYVLRHTWGYQEYRGQKKITIDEFMHGRKRQDGSRMDDGTGLSKQSVIDGVERAIVHGFLACERDEKDKARQKKYYHLTMRSDVKIVDSSDVKIVDISQKTDVKIVDPDVKKVDSGSLESRQRTEKDTGERHEEKDSDLVQDAHAPEPHALFASFPALPEKKAEKPRQAKKPKKVEEPPLKCEPTEIRQRLIAYRGYALESKGQVIQENTSVKAWCALHTLDEFEPVMRYLRTKDPYWSREENKYRIDGVVLLKESPRVLALIVRNGRTPRASPEESQTVGGYYYFSEGRS